MKVLLDESLPKDLATYLSTHAVTTVPDHGWRSKKNGELLALASREFDVFVTADQNLEHQQNLSKFDIAVVVLVAYTNRIEELVPLAPKLLEAFEVARQGQVMRVSA